jgi:hypothetical protein
MIGATQSVRAPIVTMSFTIVLNAVKFTRECVVVKNAIAPSVAFVMVAYVFRKKALIMRHRTDS